MGSESLMDGTSVAGRVQALRELMKVKGVDYYLVPSADAHQSEYVPDCWQRRTWISGFTGSAGDVVVGLEGAWAWADSRYWLQADDELDSAVYTVQRQGAHGVPGVVSWLGSKAQRRVIAVDPRLVGLGLAKRLHKAVHQGGGQVAWLESNLIDEVWDQQPSLPTPPATVWPERFAGRSVSDKLQDLREALSAASCDALVVTTLDAIAWLFNIRGTDVDFNPVLISYAIVGAEETTLFVDQSKIDAATRQHLSASGVSIDSYDSFGKALDGMSGRVWVDATYASRWAADRLDAAGVALHVARSPIMLLKAVKNAVEVAGMHTAHVRDGVAIVRFLHWLESAWQGGALDEISASDQLEAFRAEGEHYRGLSFDTISGFESNGAIVHYRASEATSKRIDDSALYLVDVAP